MHPRLLPRFRPIGPSTIVWPTGVVLVEYSYSCPRRILRMNYLEVYCGVDRLYGRRSVKRGASTVGKGSMAIHFVHQYLSRVPEQRRSETVELLYEDRYDPDNSIYFILREALR